MERDRTNEVADSVEDSSLEASNLEEEEDVCRICRNPGEESNPLYYPCACSGSIKYVHQDCLLQWLKHSNGRRCEVCKHRFSFSSIYASDTPSRLPLRELLLGALIKGWKGMQFLFRFILVLFVWFGFVPYLTCWIWRLSYTRTLSAAMSQIRGRFSPTLVLTDCFFGCLLTFGIIVFFFIVIAIREIHQRMWGNRPERPPNAPQVRPPPPAERMVRNEELNENRLENRRRLERRPGVQSLPRAYAHGALERRLERPVERNRVPDSPFINHRTPSFQTPGFDASSADPLIPSEGNLPRASRFHARLSLPNPGSPKSDSQIYGSPNSKSLDPFSTSNAVFSQKPYSSGYDSPFIFSSNVAGASGPSEMSRVSEFPLGSNHQQESSTPPLQTYPNSATTNPDQYDELQALRQLQSDYFMKSGLGTHHQGSVVPSHSAPDPTLHFHASFPNSSASHTTNPSQTRSLDVYPFAPPNLGPTFPQSPHQNPHFSGNKNSDLDTLFFSPYIQNQADLLPLPETENGVPRHPFQSPINSEEWKWRRGSGKLRGNDFSNGGSGPDFENSVPGIWKLKPSNSDSRVLESSALSSDRMSESQPTALPTNELRRKQLAENLLRDLQNKKRGRVNREASIRETEFRNRDQNEERNSNRGERNLRENRDLNAGNRVRNDARNDAGNGGIAENGAGAAGRGINDALRARMEDDIEDFGFDELIGMIGPMNRLFESALIVLAGNAAVALSTVILPFSIGRTCHSVASYLYQNPSAITPYPLFSCLSSSIPTYESSFSIFFFSKFLLSIITSLVSIPHYILSPLISFIIPYLVKSHSSLSTPTNTIIPLSSFDSFKSMHGFWKCVDGAYGITKSVENFPSPNLAFEISDYSTILLGYGIIASIVVFFLFFSFLLRFSVGEMIFGEIHRFLFNFAHGFPVVWNHARNGLRSLVSAVKVSSLLTIELGVFPVLCGWWIDVCTLNLMGSTLTQRIAFFSDFPLLSTLMHWFIGLVYMMEISLFVSILREVLRPGVLFFLRDPTDPNYNPFRDLIEDPLTKHCRRILISVFVYGNLVVMLIYLPIQASLFFSPSFFPLNLKFPNPFLQIPTDMLLFHLLIPFTIEHFSLKAIIKTSLSFFFHNVSPLLGLSDYLLPKPGDERREGEIARRGEVLAPPPPPPPPPPPLPLLHDDFENEIQEVNLENDDEEEMDDSEESSDDLFVLRIILLVFLCWFSLFTVNTCELLIPISLGRSIVSFLSFSQSSKQSCNDFYAFGIGFYALWGSYACVKFLVQYISVNGLAVFIRHIIKWLGILCKTITMVAIMMLPIPVLIGTLFDLLIIVPLRIPLDESPIFSLYQNWAIGLLMIKVCLRMIFNGQLNALLPQSWRNRFERVRNDGLQNMSMLFIMTDIIYPIVTHLLTVLCIPYIISSIFPLLGFSDYSNSAVYRYAWVFFLAFYALFITGDFIKEWLITMHDSIKDDRYLVGKKLLNFEQKHGKLKPGLDPTKAKEKMDSKGKSPLTEAENLDEGSSGSVIRRNPQSQVGNEEWLRLRKGKQKVQESAG